MMNKKQTVAQHIANDWLNDFFAGNREHSIAVGYRMKRIAKSGRSMTVKLDELFYRDDISKDITSISVGSVWLCFYKEGLVAASHLADDHTIEAAMVKDNHGPITPIAYSSYIAWNKIWEKEGAKIAEDFAIALSDYKSVTATEIQSLAMQWLGSQIALVVTDRLTGTD